MSEWRRKEIIKILIKEDDFITSEQLARSLGVSSKTILNDLRNLSHIINRYGGKIISLPGSGTKIKLEDENKINSYIEEVENTSKEFISQNIETKILYHLLFSRKKMSINTMCRELYISPSTLLYCIKRVKSLVSVHNLVIENRRNMGFEILGTEFEKRICMSQFLSEYKVVTESNDIQSTFINKKIFGDVEKIVSKVFNNLKISMSYINNVSFINYLVVAINEIKFGDHIENLYNPVDEELISNDLMVAKKITEDLSKKFNIEFSIDEELFIAILLFTTRTIPLKDVNNTTSYLGVARNKKEFSELVLAMLEKIKISTGVDFTSNQNLIFSLNAHIIPLYVRLLYGIKTENASLEGIKRHCIFAYNLAAIGVSVLVENLHVNIDDNETGYIALYLKMALEEEEKNKTKKSILFISDQNTSNVMLYLHEIRMQFEEFIKKLVWKNTNQTRENEFDEYDLIISTSKLNISTNKPILEVRRIIDTDDFRNIENHLTDRTLMKKKILELYYEELFFVDIEATTKEECIHKICTRIAKKIEIPSYFEEFVLYREMFGSTDFGEFIAIPHPYIPISSKSFISTTLLKKPILWEKNKVIAIFLISLNQYELPPAKFYDLIAELLSSSSFINTIVNDRSYNSMIRKIAETLDRYRDNKNEKQL